MCDPFKNICFTLYLHFTGKSNNNMLLAICHACKNIYRIHITIHLHDNFFFKQKISTIFKHLIFLYLFVWTDIIFFKLLYFYICY